MLARFFCTTSFDDMDPVENDDAGTAGRVCSWNWTCKRLRTLTWPPSSAPYEPGEATTCVPAVAYGLGVTKRPSGACSDSTWSIFRWFYQIVKLAAHAQKVQFGL